MPDQDSAPGPIFGGPIRIVRWGELRRVLNFWRLRTATDSPIRIQFYRRRNGHVVICRITAALENR